MDFVMPEPLRTIYDDLKKNFRPQVGDFFFFDLSTGSIALQKLPSIDELGSLMKDAYDDKKPHAAMCCNRQGAPILAFSGVTFMMEESLATGKILGFLDCSSANIEQVKREIHELKKLLSSKAC